jgi:hypothetical protein
VRTSIDIPDELFRRTKSAAALRGVSLKTLVVRALEQELKTLEATRRSVRRGKPPCFDLRSRRRLDLTGFDFDNLLP